MGALNPRWSYDDRGALLKFWEDAGVRFELKDGLLVFACDAGKARLRQALVELQPCLQDLAEEVQYQRWAEQSLQARGMDLDHLEFVRYLYQEGRLQS